MRAEERATILLAEDDAKEVPGLERALVTAGVGERLEVVTDGEQVLAYLGGVGEYANRARHPLPALLLLDLKMPRRSGFDVLAWLRQQPGLKRVPVLVFTSSRDPDDVDRAYDLGANACVVKPVAFDDLVVVMRVIVQFWMSIAGWPRLDPPK